MTLPLIDLAVGLIASCAVGTQLREWAAAMLMLSDIQFTDMDGSDYVGLTHALWAASAGADVPEESRAVAKRLAG